MPKADKHKNDDVVETAGLPDEADETVEKSEDEAGGLGDSENVMKDGESKQPGKIRRFFAGYWHRGWWTIPLTLLIIVGIIFAVPSTRYPLLAYKMQRQFSVTVFDGKTNTGISGAKVTLDGQTLATNAQGAAIFHSKVGKGSLSVSKQYYKSSSENIFVGVTHTSTNARVIRLDATGRQVPIAVVNKITGKPVADASVQVLDTSTKTDADGKAVIVLPTTSPTQTAGISASGFNYASSKIDVTSDVVSGNTFQLTPSGRVYFLSNLDGNIDVVSANLDGSGRKTVLAGTGNEDPLNTVLLASRDWKYLALLSKRDSSQNSKLYLINTSDGQLTTMELSPGVISLVGWSGHDFIYRESPANLKAWQPGQNVLKTYDAGTGKNTTIVQTAAAGNQANFNQQSLSFVNIVNDRVVYGLTWSTPIGGIAAARQNIIVSANADGTNKATLRTIQLPQGTFYSSMTAVVYKPETLYIQSTTDASPNGVFYTYNYDNNSLSQSNTLSSDTFFQSERNPATYLESPDGKLSFWSQVRDGKNTLFVGDYDSVNGKQIASLSDYTQYGWYTNDYLLVEKGGSELYVMPASGGTALKISDYYKPPQNFYGYGGGYGGL